MTCVVASWFVGEGSVCVGGGSVCDFVWVNHENSRLTWSGGSVVGLLECVPFVPCPCVCV